MDIGGMDTEWPIDSSLENFTGTDLSSEYICIIPALIFNVSCVVSVNTDILNWYDLELCTNKFLSTW